MNSDTVKLLKEINSGCKNATDSFGQVEDMIKSKYLKELVNNYNKEHVKIGDECHQMLNDSGLDEKDPPSMAKAMMWITTEMKMMINDGDCKIADLLADGCNMGIKSVSKYMNQYKKADRQAMALAGSLVKTEEELHQKLMQFI